MSEDHSDRLKRIQSLCEDISKSIHNSQQQRKTALELAQEAAALAEACKPHRDDPKGEKKKVR